MSKIIRIVLASLFALILSFGAGYGVGRFADTGKSESNPIDTSSVDRIVALARSGLVEERADIERQRSGLDVERKRIAEERAIDQRERDRIVTERKGYADIEKLCRDTIRILQARGAERKMEK